MGVCPFGAQVVPVLARNEPPVSSTKTISAPRWRAFFWCEANHGWAKPGPTLHLKTCLQGSPAQYLQQVLPSVGGQARRTSQHWSVLQTSEITPAVPELLGPSTHSRATDTDLSRNGRLGQMASLQLPTSVQTAFFQLRTGEMSWSPDHRHAL